MGTNVASCLGYVLFAGMVSSMGTTTFAAHSIAVSAEELFYIPGYGLRTASSALIGNALGEGNERKLLITERLSIALTLVLMFLGGVLLYLTAFPLMKVFTISLPVAELGAQVLRLVAFTEPFFGLMVVFEGIFYGKGKAKGIFAIETAGMWGIRLLFTFLCVNVWHLSLEAVWYCMIADNIFKAVCLMALYLHDRRRAS
jgi:Na+-driven multidrug efflux pump